MKKTVVLVFTAFVALLFACAVPSGTSGTAETPNQGKDKTKDKTIELIFATYRPTSHWCTTKQIPEWVDEIEKATNGRVHITFYPGGTLLGSEETYDGVVAGVAHISEGVFSYTLGRFPFMQAFEQPGIPYNDARVATKVAWEGWKQLQPAETAHVKMLNIFATGPGYLITKKPIRTLEDFQGMEIRATGISAQTIISLGGTPVAMPMPDSYIALQKGIVKGNLCPLETLESYKFYEVTSYVTITPPSVSLYNALFYTVMNKKTWDSLPPDIQKAFDEVNEKFIDRAGEIWQSHMKAGLDLAVKKGMQVIYLSEQEAARWGKVLEETRENYVWDMKGLRLPGEDVLSLVFRLCEQYNKLYPPEKY